MLASIRIGMLEVDPWTDSFPSERSSAWVFIEWKRRSARIEGPPSRARGRVFRRQNIAPEPGKGPASQDSDAVLVEQAEASRKLFQNRRQPFLMFAQQPLAFLSLRDVVAGANEARRPPEGGRRAALAPAKT